MKLVVKRVSIVEEGAFGVILDDDVPFGVTLERTYDEESGQIVKIPPGTYLCKRTFYFKGGYPTFEIMVPGHSRILFHKANLEEQLEGCIAIGEQFGVLDGKPGILQSGGGFAEFWGKVRNFTEFDLVVE